jgi:Putative lumazine-binding
MPAAKRTDYFDIDIYDQIRDVVERAMKGAKNGSRNLLRSAFHEKAQMFGEVMGTRYDEGIESFFDLWKEHPLGKNGGYRSRIVSISRVGNAAMVMVAEDGCWGSASFVDFFTVTRIERHWKIHQQNLRVHRRSNPAGSCGSTSKKAPASQ